jgi:hypothetical protein
MEPTPQTPLTQEDCDFYHTFGLSSGEIVRGQWDLRGRESEYLGGVAFAGRRVLEIGPASGFLSLFMEQQGAMVTAVDLPLSEDSYWDLVRRPGEDWREIEEEFLSHIKRIRNSFWFTHREFSSRNQLVEADSTRLPESIGDFEVGVISAVLLHAAAPVSLVNSLARHVTDTIIITEPYFAELDGESPLCMLQPSPENLTHNAWWQFSPKMIENLVSVLGFTDITTTKFEVPYFGPSGFDETTIGTQIPFFSVVARVPS